MKKLFLNTVVAMSLMALLAACSEGGDTDPYAMVTLRQATHGMVVSKQFKYKFSSPELVAVHRHLGLIREGNQLEFIAARSLEDKLAGHENDKDLEFAVVKRFSPFVHFKVERIVSGVDTIFPAQAGGIALPSITSPDAYGVDNFEDYDIHSIAWNNTGLLNKLKEEKIRVRAQIVEEMVEGSPQFWLIGDRAKLRIGSVSDATGLFLKVLANSNYIFEGGIHMIEVEPFGDRRENHVAGTVAVDYLMYGNRLVTGG